MNHPRKRLQYLGSDYDIREVDEDLYLAVLAKRKAEDACSAVDLSGSSTLLQTTATDRKRQEMG
jgi:hypothetical protein